MFNLKKLGVCALFAMSTMACNKDGLEFDNTMEVFDNAKGEIVGIELKIADRKDLSGKYGLLDSQEALNIKFDGADSHLSIQSRKPPYNYYYDGNIHLKNPNSTIGFLQQFVKLKQ